MSFMLTDPALCFLPFCAWKKNTVKEQCLKVELKPSLETLQVQTSIPIEMLFIVLEVRIVPT